MTTAQSVLVLALGSALAASPAFAADAGSAEASRRTALASRNVSVENIAEREIARRQEMIARAETAIEAGDKAMDDKDYDTAVAQYKHAADLLPNARTTQRMRDKAVDRLCDATVKLAEQRIAEGRHKDAETLLKDVLRESYDPDNRAVIKLLSHLEDPEYFNRTITPKYRAEVETVKKLFIEAQGYYDTGRYDRAFDRYEKILNLDPYNIAARKGQEKVNEARTHYSEQAYNETRSRQLWQLQKAWEMPVRKFGIVGPERVTQLPVGGANTEYIQNKLQRIIIPKISFDGATVREAIDFLKKKSAELDITEPDPARKGVNIVLKIESSGGGGSFPSAPPAAAPAAGIPGLEAPAAAPIVEAAPAGPIVNPAEARITLSLTNIPLVEALKYITNLANLKFKVDAYAVSIVPITEPTDVMITKEYRVPPSLIPNTPVGGADAGGGPLAAPGDATRQGRGIAAKSNALEFLKSQGVEFPPGASANYLPSSSRLIVRNTQQNLDLVDVLVETSLGTPPQQIEIESKFIEIAQQNMKELSFDWLLGQFNISPSQSVFGSGGTSGTSPAIATNDYPFVPPGATAPAGQNPITAGNRSGNIGISTNAIDALLFGLTGASLKAPGTFSVAGALTDPQFQVVIRALNQKKGVDLLSAPRVTTKSGQRAVIEIIREFRYPTEFDPPQIPQNFGGNSGGGGGGIGGQSIMVSPVTPTTPTSFETRNTGVTLEVEPTVGPDGFTIDLNLVPQVVEFEGFVNYGSPIRTVNPAAFGALGAVGGALGVPDSVVLTDNVINQPIFSTRKVTTSVSVWDGSTVVLGGLMREDVQKVEDKIPLLGDIPLLGRLFRSSIDQHLKRNLVIFVTARLINPAGEPIQKEEEEEEKIEPLPLPMLPPGPPAPEAPLFPK